MPEVPRPGEYHGDAVVVGCLDHFVVAQLGEASSNY